MSKNILIIHHYKSLVYLIETVLKDVPIVTNIHSLDPRKDHLGNSKVLHVNSDVIIIDIETEKGKEWLVALNEISDHKSKIFAITDKESNLEDFAYENGVNEFIYSPFDIIDLKGRIQRVLWKEVS